MAEIETFTLPDIEKYSSLPRNLKNELTVKFEQEHEKSLIPFLDGRTKWTPVIGTSFSNLLNSYYDYYLQQEKAAEL